VGLVLREAKLRQKTLGWRDVKMILAESATKPSSATWQPTRIQFNDDYGFGIVNAAAAVALVSSWVPVGNSAWTSKTLGTGFLGPTGSGTLDDGGGTFLSMTNFIIDNGQAENGTSIFNSTISYIEYVTLEVKVSHTDPGDLEIGILKTPIAGGSAALSKVTKAHSCLDENGGSVGCTTASSTIYEFGVTNFLGESAQGTWELKIRDARSNGKTGTVIGWRLKIYGH
jgi:subtilisin-like proprotein convertase family protein